jgi:MarR family transcriptional regulator, 2-MHQ and catechol-resistance regulon repressor
MKFSTMIVYKTSKIKDYLLNLQNRSQVINKDEPMEFEQLQKMNFKSLQQKAVINTQVTANSMASKFNKFMSEFDLSMAQFNILRILRGANEALTISTVKSRMIEKSPNTTRLLDKLLVKGLIKKMGCKEDRRQFYIEITEDGKSLLQRIDESGFESMVDTKVLSDEEADLLNSLLDRLRRSF